MRQSTNQKQKMFKEGYVETLTHKEVKGILGEVCQIFELENPEQLP